MILLQLDEHFSRPMKEFVSLCLKKLPAEVCYQRFFLVREKSFQELTFYLRLYSKDSESYDAKFSVLEFETDCRHLRFCRHCNTEGTLVISTTKDSLQNNKAKGV